MLFLFVHCKAQKNAKKTPPMKQFDITTFENKNQSGQYSFYLEDSTRITQSDDDYEYYEKIETVNSHFWTINRYYKNGVLKSTVDYYPNQFFKGTLSEYNEQGESTSEKDYDAPYKYNWEDILTFIEERELDMTAYGFTITRSFGFGTENIGQETETPFWALTYNKSSQDQLLGIIIINGITGEIIEEYQEPYPSEE